MENLPDQLLVHVVCRYLYPSDIEQLCRASMRLRSVLEAETDLVYALCQHLLPHGEEVLYGSVIRYRDGKKRGVTVTSQSFMVDVFSVETRCFNPNGQLHGPVSLVDSSGVRVVSKFYINGELFGKAFTRYPDGSPRDLQVFSKPGKLTLRKTWRAGGVLNRVCAFDIAGRRHGTWVKWRRSGVLEYRKRYAHGARVGEWKFYDETGRYKYSNFPNADDDRMTVVPRPRSRACGSTRAPETSPCRCRRGRPVAR